MDRRLRVLAVGPTPPPYFGMSIATGMLMGPLVADGIDVVLLDTADRRGMSNVGRFDLVNVWLALKHGALFLGKLVRERPDLVYVPIAQNLLGFLRDSLFLVPSHLAGKPVVIHVHGSHFGRFYAGASAPLRWAIRALVGRARSVVVLGESLRGIMDGVVDPSRIVVVPNGLADFMGGEAPRRPVDDPPVVLYLSTLVEEKGVLDVLAAAASVVRDHPGAEFRFAGEWYKPADRERGEALVRDAGLEGSVRFVGIVGPEAKREQLARADVFVLPSHRTPGEGQPYALIEAMCAGVPAVVTAVGAMPETVADGETGIVIEPDDMEALAESIGALVGEADLRRRMGAAARRRFLDLYTDRRWAADMVRVFEKAGGGAPVAESQRGD